MNVVHHRPTRTLSGLGGSPRAIPAACTTQVNRSSIDIEASSTVVLELTVAVRVPVMERVVCVEPPPRPPNECHGPCLQEILSACSLGVVILVVAFGAVINWTSLGISHYTGNLHLKSEVRSGFEQIAAYNARSDAAREQDAVDRKTHRTEILKLLEGYRKADKAQSEVNRKADRAEKLKLLEGHRKADRAEILEFLEGHRKAD